MGKYVRLTNPPNVQLSQSTPGSRKERQRDARERRKLARAAKRAYALLRNKQTDMEWRQQYENHFSQ
jgi:hypothetical protein